MISNKVKLLSAAVAAAALMASPALAASKTHKAKVPYSNAYAFQPQQARELVGWEGQYLGTDPDPNIRFQLLRDQNLGGD
ncbi:MAG: hypothetical protein WBG10_01505 [Pseudolabrys sp.]